MNKIRFALLFNLCNTVNIISLGGLMAFGAPVLAKSVVFGDSMSAADGKFGSGLAQWKSQRGQTSACLFSVSGATLGDWLGKSRGNGKFYFDKPIDSTYGLYRNGQKISLDEQAGSQSIKKVSNEKPSIQNVLNNPAAYCGDKAPIDDITLQLGTNREKSENDYLNLVKETLTIARQAKVKTVNFVLPPFNKGFDFSGFDSRMEAAIKDLASKYPDMKISAFNSVKHVQINPNDFRKGDKDHIWGSKSEGEWLAKTKDFLSGVDDGGSSNASHE